MAQTPRSKPCTEAPSLSASLSNRAARHPSVETGWDRGPSAVQPARRSVRRAPSPFSIRSASGQPITSPARAEDVGVSFCLIGKETQACARACDSEWTRTLGTFTRLSEPGTEGDAGRHAAETMRINSTDFAWSMALPLEALHRIACQRFIRRRNARDCRDDCNKGSDEDRACSSQYGSSSMMKPVKSSRCLGRPLTILR